MAAIATATTTSQEPRQAEVVTRGTIAVVTGTYVTGGLALDLTANFPLGENLIAAAPPVQVQIISSKSGSTDFFVYKYVAGTNPTNGFMQVFEQNSTTGGLVELGTGTIPATVVSDTISFTATWAKMQ